MMDTVPGWLLERGVPWWAFLLALLTSPSRWSGLVVDVLRRRVGRGRTDE